MLPVRFLIKDDLFHKFSVFGLMVLQILIPTNSKKFFFARKMVINILGKSCQRFCYGWLCDSGHILIVEIID